MKPEPDSSLAGKDLRGQDLRGQDLSGKVLFETDLRGAQLDGTKISLSCQTFDGVKLDETQIATLLLMLANVKVDGTGGWTEDLHMIVCDRLGFKRYEALRRLLRLV